MRYLDGFGRVKHEEDWFDVLLGVLGFVSFILSPLLLPSDASLPLVLIIFLLFLLFLDFARDLLRKSGDRKFKKQMEEEKFKRLQAEGYSRSNSIFGNARTIRIMEERRG
jgi:hypothetical protein